MRTRLVVVAFAVTAMVALAFVVPLMILVRDLAADRELSAAERDAAAVARLIAVVGADPADRLVGPVITAGGEFNGRPVTIVVGADPADRLVGPVITAGGEFNGRPVTIVVGGGETIGTPLDPGEDLSEAASGRAVRQPVVGGDAIYVPVLGPEGETVVVRALAAEEEMTSGVATAWWTLGLLAAVLVVLAVVVADRLGRTMVRPVDDLADAADRMGSGDLDARVEVSGPPETRRVGTAFNRLAAQIVGLLQWERETAADLSHRLRTPLTGARLNADALPDSDRKERLIEQLDEVERVVDHIIDEMRRPDRQARATVTDVEAVVADRVEFWEPLATDEGRALTARLSGGRSLVAAPEADLAAAIDALIGNVLAHTEPGVDLSVSVQHPGDGHVDVTVADEGDGLPDGFSAAARGSSGTDSTGLGLDIVRQTADASGGDLRLGTSALGGAEVTMRLRLAGSR